MKTVPIHFAKTHLSRLVEQACAGEEIVIARSRTPLVRLVPFQTAPPKRQFGAMRGRARVDDTFFEPLPREELQRWE
jgi:antitoxin (DNA-binding transcriptional repressor) of toxin-antitoxin stability system